MKTHNSHSADACFCRSVTGSRWRVLTERLSRVSHRGNNKVHTNLRRMQERIVNQAFANGFEQPFLVSLFDRPWTLQFDMNIVESGRTLDLLCCGAYANAFRRKL